MEQILKPSLKFEQKSKDTIMHDISDFHAEIKTTDNINLFGHISKNIVITNNNRYLAIFKIGGIDLKVMADEQVEIHRANLNAFIMANVQDNLTFHIIQIKRKTDFNFTKAHYSDFAQRINNKYIKNLTNSETYTHSVYLVVEKKIDFVDNIANYFWDLWGKITKKFESKNRKLDLLNANIKTFTGLLKKIEFDLSFVNAELLGTYIHNDKECSHIASVYLELLGFKKSHVFIPDACLSKSISNFRLLVNNEIGEIRNNLKSVFFNCFSIVDYSKSTGPFDFLPFVDAAIEYNFSQSFNALNKSSSLKILNQSLKNLIAAGTKSPTLELELIEATDLVHANDMVFGNYNNRIIIFGHSPKKLYEASEKGVSLLDNNGMVIVREDAGGFIAQYLGQIPGSLDVYKVRQEIITSKNFIDFAPMFKIDEGKKYGNHWGEAISVFKTMSHTPYFLSLHFEDVGHSFISGKTGSGKTLFMSFLLTQFEKFKAKHLIFDYKFGMLGAVLSLGGNYIRLTAGKKTGLNPFSHPLTPKHKSYLFVLIKIISKMNFTSDDEQELNQAITGVYSMNHKDINLSSLMDFLDTTKENGIYSRLKSWTGEQRNAWIFDNGIETLDIVTNNINAIDLTDFLDDDDIRDPIISYLIYRKNELLTGQRIVFWYDELWKGLSNKSIAKELRKDIKTLRSKNGLIISATQSPNDIISKDGQDLLNEMSTKIFLPNSSADKDVYMGRGFNLNPVVWDKFSKLHAKSRQFLVIQEDVSKFLDFKLHNMDEEIILLSPRQNICNFILNYMEKNDGILPVNWQKQVIKENKL